MTDYTHNMNIRNCDLKSQSNFKVKESKWNRKLIQNVYLAVLRGFAIDASAPTPSASAASSASCWSRISCISTTLEGIETEEEDNYTLQD